MTRPAGMPADFRSGPARVIIATRSGVIKSVSTTVLDLIVTVFDMDKAKRGEISSENLATRTFGEPIFADETPAPMLDTFEIHRYAEELSELSKESVITLFATIAATVPGGTAALRDWLKNALEDDTPWCEHCGEGRIIERDGFMLCSVCDEVSEDSPEYDAAMNHLARNGPYP